MKLSGLGGQMVFIFVFSLVLYCHSTDHLNGPWILDDKGTVSMNPTITGDEPWIEIWLRDFWGHDRLTDTDSHKSWRPLCSATYKLNQIFGNGAHYWFHLTDRVIHAAVSAISLPTGVLLFSPCSHIDGFEPHLAGLVFSLLFASHPIHVEAVANTTGRAEVLCAFFYLLGFLVFAWGVKRSNQSEVTISILTITSNSVALVVMLMCCCCSMLCKEHGITLPVFVCLWDAFLGTSTSISEILAMLTTSPTPYEGSRRRSCQLFLFRVVLSTVGTLSLGYWRISKNGDYIPDFSCEQNPGACLPLFHERFLHFSWLWVTNFMMLVWPSKLSPDWSGPSIDPMVTVTDERAGALPILYLTLLGLGYFTLAEAWSEGARESSKRSFTRLMLVSFWFMMITFVLSSNLLVYVGFVVADRTLYLPSYGFLGCLTLLLFMLPHKIAEMLTNDKTVPSSTNSQSGTRVGTKRRSFGVSLGLSAVVLSLYVKKQLSQTALWADPVELWGEAYRVNPNSCINGGEYGMSLTNAQRPLDAVPVLWETHRRELENGWFNTTIQRSTSEAAKWQRMAQLITTRFKLTTALGNSGHCAKAVPLIDEALQLFESRMPSLSKEKQAAERLEQLAPTRTNVDEAKSLREAEMQLSRNKGYLLVAKSRCATDLASMAQIAVMAVNAAPNLPFAQDHANSVASLIEEARRASGLSPDQVKISFAKNPDGGQNAIRTFSQVTR